jgi:hypothetical protein
MTLLSSAFDGILPTPKLAGSSGSIGPVAVGPAGMLKLGVLLTAVASALLAGFTAGIV